MVDTDDVRGSDSTEGDEDGPESEALRRVEHLVDNGDVRGIDSTGEARPHLNQHLVDAENGRGSDSTEQDDDGLEPGLKDHINPLSNVADHSRVAEGIEVVLERILERKEGGVPEVEDGGKGIDYTDKVRPHREGAVPLPSLLLQSHVAHREDEEGGPESEAARRGGGCSHRRQRP